MSAMYGIDSPAVQLDPKTGVVVFDRRKLGENAFFLHAYDNPLAVAVGVPKSTVFYNPQDGQGVGDMEIRELVAWGNVPFLVSLKELGGPAGVDLQNNPIHHGFVFGTGEAPLPLAEPLYVPGGHALQALCQNLSSTLAASLKMAAKGRKFNVDLSETIRREVAAAYDRRGARPFWLTLDNTSVTLTSLQNRSQQYMTMPSGWHFCAKRLHVESTGPFTLDIYDREGRRLTCDGPIDSRLLLTPGGVDVSVLGPLLTQPAQKLRFELTDISGAANTVYLTFHGTIVRNAK